MARDRAAAGGAAAVRAQVLQKSATDRGGCPPDQAAPPVHFPLFLVPSLPFLSYSLPFPSFYFSFFSFLFLPFSFLPLPMPPPDMHSHSVFVYFSVVACHTLVLQHEMTDEEQVRGLAVSSSEVQEQWR